MNSTKKQRVHPLTAAQVTLTHKRMGGGNLKTNACKMHKSLVCWTQLGLPLSFVCDKTVYLSALCPRFYFLGL